MREKGELTEKQEEALKYVLLKVYNMHKTSVTSVYGNTRWGIDEIDIFEFVFNLIEALEGSKHIDVLLEE